MHIITDAIYVVCQSGPKHRFLNMSSSLPTALTPRIRLHLQWLGAATGVCPAGGVQSPSVVTHAPLGPTVAAICLLASLVVRRMLPIRRAPDLVSEGAVSQYSLQRQ